MPYWQDIKLRPWNNSCEHCTKLNPFILQLYNTAIIWGVCTTNRVQFSVLLPFNCPGLKVPVQTWLCCLSVQPLCVSAHVFMFMTKIGHNVLALTFIKPLTFPYVPLWWLMTQEEVCGDVSITVTETHRPRKNNKTRTISGWSPIPPLSKLVVDCPQTSLLVLPCTNKVQWRVEQGPSRSCYCTSWLGLLFSAWTTTITTSAHSPGSWTQVRGSLSEGADAQLMLHAVARVWHLICGSEVTGTAVGAVLHAKVYSECHPPGMF